MRNPVPATLSLVALAALAGCGGGRSGAGMGHRSGLDEFAVSRRAPLTVPPDFALMPPKPGAPRPQEADTSTQALNAMFGGRQQGSQGEAAVAAQAGRVPDPGIRSTAGAPDTTVVNKGAVTRDILNAPASSNPQAEATATAPQ
ncbi:MAG: DUF3035 domain-containing protein [Sphingomonas fennica]